MPELPEVETIARDLRAHILNRKILTVQVFSPATVSLPAYIFIKNLVGRKVTKIERRGKLLIFSLTPVFSSVPRTAAEKTGRRTAGQDLLNYLLIHLKMTGQLIYIDKKSWVAGGHSLAQADKKGARADKTTADSLAEAVGGSLPNKHTRVALGLAGGGQLFFNDLRKFGYFKLTTARELERLLQQNYGPEPLTPGFTLAALTAALYHKKTKVKALLLDQKRIAGLGNIYVDEALHAARLLPTRLAASLQPEEIKALRSAINRIIKTAIKYRGTTFSDYVDSSGQPGNFSRFLKVYGRAGEKCRNCGRRLVKIKVAGRGTHYCPACQK